MTDAVPGDGMKALADFWTAQGTAMLQAQQAAMRSMADSMQTLMTTGATLPAAGLSASNPAQPDLTKTVESAMALWSAASGLSTDLAQRLTKSVAGQDGADLASRIADPRQWLTGAGGMDEMLSGLADAPRLADLFDVERRYASVMRRWTELRRISLEHQQLLIQTWMQAGRAYMTELAGRVGAAGKPLEAKAALALWAEIGNKAMIEAQRGEPYLRSQRALIRASTELRLAQAELSEHIGKQYGLPTRTELDDVHRALTEMRRELRKARRELDALKAAEPPRAKPETPLPAPAPARRKAR